jgi:uncharacterized HAD superfamily protein
MKNATQHFVEFDSYEFFALDESKEPGFARFEPSFLIEDNLKNARLGVKHGHKVFLMNTTHNQTDDDTGFKRVYSWDEISEAIQDAVVTSEFQL